MSTIERREAIARWVIEKGLAKVDDLSESFQVSTVTIRNDLNYLDKKGMVVRSHGGAMSIASYVPEVAIEDKHSVNCSQKEAIGATAATLISEGESVILDSGSTTHQVARRIRNHRNLVVMTNGLNIALELAESESIEVMMTGGSLRKKSYSFYGTQAEEALSQYRFDKLFLGTDGFDLNVGLTTHFDREASLNRIMCNIATEVILVTDSSKFGRKGYHFIRSFGAFHTLVTDKGIPGDYLAELKRQGVQVIIADE